MCRARPASSCGDRTAALRPGWDHEWLRAPEPRAADQSHVGNAALGCAAGLAAEPLEAERRYGRALRLVGQRARKARVKLPQVSDVLLGFEFFQRAECRLEQRQGWRT